MFKKITAEIMVEAAAVIGTYFINPDYMLIVAISVFVILFIAYFWGEKAAKTITFWAFAKMHKDKALLFELQTNQRVALGDYLSCGIEAIDYTGLKELTPRLTIRLWFVNGSMFNVEPSEFKKFEVKCDGDSLPEHESIPFERTLSGRMNVYPFRFNVSSGLLAKLDEYATNCRFAEWSISLDWVFVYGEDETTHLRKNLKYKGVPEIQ